MEHIQKYFVYKSLYPISYYTHKGIPPYPRPSIYINGCCSHRSFCNYVSILGDLLHLSFLTPCQPCHFPLSLSICSLVYIYFNLPHPGIVLLLDLYHCAFFPHEPANVISFLQELNFFRELNSFNFSHFMDVLNAKLHRYDIFLSFVLSPAILKTHSKALDYLT